MTPLARSVTVLCALLGVACQNLEQPTPSTTSRLVIHGVLQPGFGVTILVSRSRNGVVNTSLAGIGDDEPVIGALVTVSFPSGESRIAKEGLLCNCPGQYVLPVADVDVRPGASFTLHVHTTSGEDASGATTIPSAPAQWPMIVRTDLVRARDTLRLHWGRVPGARSYEVVVSSAGLTTYRTFADTSIVIPGAALTIDGDMIFLPAGIANVVVVAVDENYYDYYRAQSDPFAGTAPGHLTGAVGVFGSVATVMVERFNVR